MKKLVTGGGVIILIIISSCKHDMVAPGTNVNLVYINNNIDSVCFQNDVLPLFQSYCGSSGCHNASSRTEDVILTDYFDIMRGVRANNPSGSKYFNKIGHGMPPGNYPQMSSTQIILIEKWINQSATNTICNNICDTSNYTFSGSIQSIISTNCLGCHGTSPGLGNVYLGDYTSIKNYISSNQQTFFNSINYSTSIAASLRMPPVEQLSNCQIKEITKWINNSFPQ